MKEELAVYQKTTTAALRAFLGGSSGVFTVAITYCAVTANYLAMSLLCGGVAIMATVSFFLFRKGY